MTLFRAIFMLLSIGKGVPDMKRIDTRQLAEEFLQCHAQMNTYPFTNNRIFEYEKKSGKGFFEMSDKDFVEFFFDEVKINSVATLDCYRTIYSGFYRWCIEKRYTENRNIFEESVYLDPDTLAAYMAEKCSIYYYSEEDVEFLCQKAEECPVLSEVIIRCFYEGISSYDELIHLHKEQVDVTNHRIRLADRSIAISDRLSCLLEKLILGEVEMEAGRNGYRLQRFAEEDVFLFRIAKDTDTNRKQFLKRRLERVSACADVKVTAKILYQSGLLQAVWNACDNEEERLIQVLYENKNKKTNFVLDNILKENGYSIRSSRVRYMFKPYMIQLLASHGFSLS